MVLSKRYFLEIAYNGAAYSGWQIQDNADSVQNHIQIALSTAFRETVTVIGASRTDTGVHARQNFAHFDAINDPPKEVIRKLNFLLPDDIAVQKLILVNQKAHARFDAVSRSYEYEICYSKNPFKQAFSCYYPYKHLPIKKLNEAASFLLAHNDYAAFSKKRTQVKTTMCNISEAEWKKTNDGLIFYITANRFLRGMVRGLVGTMIRMGRGNLSIDDFKELLNSKEPHKTDFSAPAQGLSLMEVKYPEGYFDEFY
jgi:tRNA pseudouridine38-40 synthase